ncbi:hypothetical protein C8Q78DRAFT_982908 [Trametes maxima]|nr:hypothetical protein C8Q78DRAFT_982908 [Trametes maxima]
MLSANLFVSAAAVFSLLSSANGATPAASGTFPMLTAVPSGITACSETCIAQAALANGCSNVTDVQCICTNAQFLNSARDCLLKQCPIQDGEAALKDFQQLCGGLASSATASTATAPSSTLTVLPTSAAETSSTAVDTETSLSPSSTDGSTSAAASQTTNAAAALSPVLAVGSNLAGLLGVSVVVVGAALGTGFVF